MDAHVRRQTQVAVSWSELYIHFYREFSQSHHAHLIFFGGGA